MENYCLTSGSYYSAMPYNRFTRLWQASEGYLDIGQKKYRVSDLGNLSLSEDHSWDTKIEIAVRVLKMATYILFPLALGALAIRTYCRSKWRISQHIAEYKGISHFPITPAGQPILSRHALLELQRPKPQPQPLPVAPSAPRNNVEEMFPIEFAFAPVLPPQQPDPTPLMRIELGTQTAGNDVVRVVNRNGDVDIPNNTIVSMEDGNQYRYIRGNNNTDILFRI